MIDWFRNVGRAVSTLAQGMFVTLSTAAQTYRRKPFTSSFAYPEKPVPIPDEIRALLEVHG